MTNIAAITATVILAALAVFQAFLAAGRPLGQFAWGGQHKVLPERLRKASAISIGLYAVFALVILDRAGIITLLPDLASQIGIWVLAAYFSLGIVMNGMSRSKPERYTMTPVVTALAACCYVLALS